MIPVIPINLIIDFHLLHFVADSVSTQGASVGLQLSQVWGHFFSTQFLEHFPWDFHFSHLLVGTLSEQDDTVVVVGAGGADVVGPGGAGVGLLPLPVMVMSEHALKCSCAMGFKPTPHSPVSGSHAQVLPAMYVH